jgi:hypothetical protein
MPLEAFEPFEADPFAIASAPLIDEPPLPASEPTEQFATDITLGLPDDGTAPTLSDPRDAATLDGLESFSEPAFGLSADPAPALEVESFFETPVVPPVFDEFVSAAPGVGIEPESMPIDGGHDEPVDEPIHILDASQASAYSESEPAPELEPAADGAEPEAFVTETMAELYLQQGHLEAALDIYQRLAEQRPGDEYLADRVRAVADSIVATADAMAEESSDDAFIAADVPAFDEPAMSAEPAEAFAPAANTTGLTIREFLSELLRPREQHSFDGLGSTNVETPSFETSSFEIPSFENPESASIFETPDFETQSLQAPSLESSVLGTSSLEAPVADPASADSGDVEAVVADSTLADLPFVDSTFAQPDTPVVEASIPEPSFDEPTFEESPFEARTLEIEPLNDSAALLATPPDPVSEFVDALDDEVEVVDEIEVTFELPVADVADVAAVTPEPAEVPAAPTTSRPTPASETVSGSIDALFSGADASSSDATAANTLAQAFASEGPDTAPLQGMPAHRAANELSLDHVFKVNPAPRPESESEGFSFDQFFADDMTEPAPKPGAEPLSPSSHASDDIAQFNNWLNGLKKT